MPSDVTITLAPTLKNSLLNQLDYATLSALKPRLHTGRLSRGTVLFEAGQALQSVWFPTSGVVSLSSTTADGSSVEVAAIGSEGLIGGSLALGLGVAMCRASIQVEGEAMWTDARTFSEAVRAHPDLQAAVTAFIGTLLLQIIQSNACNRFHSGEQRLSRWLLETADRVGASAFPLTQEFLAHMLGMRRPWVTKVIHRLSERGCIRYRRGELLILNRGRLEKASCDCYAHVRQSRAHAQPVVRRDEDGA